MNEVISRRLRRALDAENIKNKENESFSNIPDLILVDGGKGQVNAALQAAYELGIKVQIAGMVKDSKHRTRGLILKDGSEIDLKKAPKVLKLVAEIQEEVHRFAIEYHRKLRKNELIKSVLDEIKGIGETRKRELFKHFGSLEEIRKASVNQLEKVKGMNMKIAKDLYDYFH
jgi:excinuclease ABC subunit C